MFKLYIDSTPKNTPPGGKIKLKIKSLTHRTHMVKKFTRVNSIFKKVRADIATKEN